MEIFNFYIFLKNWKKKFSKMWLSKKKQMLQKNIWRIYLMFCIIWKRVLTMIKLRKYFKNAIIVKHL